MSRTVDEAIDKLTDFRLMALLLGIPEVIANSQDSSLSSAVNFSMMQNAALIHMGYPRKYHEAGRWHQSLQLEGLLTGVTINTSATDLAPIKKISAQEIFKG